MLHLNWPNRLTILRILMIGPFVVALLNLQEDGYENIARWAALIIFGIMAVSDGLDGYLARKLREESAMGRFLDPLADKILIICSVILLVQDGTHVPGSRLPSWVAVVAVGKDLIVVLGFCIVYLATTRIYIEPRLLGKWCTTMQLAMIIGVLISPDLPAAFRVVLPVLWWLASALAVATIVQYFQMARRFLERHEIRSDSTSNSSSR